MEAVDLLIKFLRFAIPLIPGLKEVAADFWGSQGLGPLPPDLAAWDADLAAWDADLAAWDAVDRKVDAQLRLSLDDTLPGSPGYSEPGDQ